MPSNHRAQRPRRWRYGRTAALLTGGITLVGLAAVNSPSAEPTVSDYLLSQSNEVSRSASRPSAAVSVRDEISYDKAAAAQAQVSRAAQSPAAPAGLSTAPCPSGSGVESGLKPHTIAVHRAACAEFAFVKKYGGRGGGDHATGKALDIMVSGDAGWEIAKFMRQHATELGISYVIYQQKIWSAERAGEGWRPQPDRGSATANHYDHVHVSTY